MSRSAEERRAFVETRAEQMKAAPTTAETAAWEILRPLGFVRQWPIHGETKNGGAWDYIADFYCAPSWSSKLIVEVDGSSHREKAGRDRRRDTRIATEGIVTLRFTNRQVLNHGDEVRLRVASVMDRLAQGPGVRG